MRHEDVEKTSLNRRHFLKVNTAVAATVGASQFDAQAGAASVESKSYSISFDRPDSLFHGHEWETLNPGYWRIHKGALRRRIGNYGDRARSTGFPFHYETHRRNGGVMNVDYDPSLPTGVLYHRHWNLSGEYRVSAKFTFLGHKIAKREGDSNDWKMYQNGFGLMGIAFGAKSLFESYGKDRNATIVSWTDDGNVTVASKKLKGEQPSLPTPELKTGDQVELSVHVTPVAERLASVRVETSINGKRNSFQIQLNRKATEGYFGIASRGLIDFEVNQVEVAPYQNSALDVGHVECYTCYPLGDTLKNVNGQWKVRFVGLFSADGETTEIRIAESEQPAGGWQNVPVAGKGHIINNQWRRNSATVEAILPADPSEKTLYFTVWKDGKNVTSDPRIGSHGSGPGTGFVGDVPVSGSYVGRLPRLRAPYKLCGLSCHAITSGLQRRTSDGFKILGGGDHWQFRDQPTMEAYKHFEDYEFQILCWEDDVWYMELVLYPPSTDDAYRIVTTTIGGPTSRWQMMRHWNVLNPGDHDYGMDDVKGPEQIAIRLRDGLGQDKDYMRRNFQIVHHLITGDEVVDPLINPKKWRAWKMPNRDFTFVILDARLWRSSQDTAMWDDEGWGHLRELYDRSDPTRSLLGEEQFAWLQQLVRTDSAQILCLTGLNGLHTVWTGGNRYSNTDSPFAQRDRVAADYAGWVAAGADRVIELLGSRDGIVSVYGDVHNGCIMRNTVHGLYECSFGPIGRSGGRAVIPGFGRQMKDYDGRPLEVHSLYHKTHADPDLNEHGKADPFYWNFLEMEFDPMAEEAIGLRVRNMIDAPNVTPRGGGSVATALSATGRRPSSQLPPVTTLPHADVRVTTTEGQPVRGMRSGGDGRLLSTSLVDVEVGVQVIVTAFDGVKSESQVVTTQTS